MPRSGIAGSYGSPTFSFLSNLNSPFVASLVAQMVKNLPAMQETWVQSLGQEDPLEKGMAPHCSILAWKIPWTLLNRCLSACKCRGCAYLVRPEWKAWMVFRFAGHSPKWSKGAPVSFCQIFCVFPYLLENIPSCPSLRLSRLVGEVKEGRRNEHIGKKTQLWCVVSTITRMLQCSVERKEVSSLQDKAHLFEP